MSIDEAKQHLTFRNVTSVLTTVIFTILCFICSEIYGKLDTINTQVIKNTVILTNRASLLEKMGLKVDDTGTNVITLTVRVDNMEKDIESLK